MTAPLAQGRGRRPDQRRLSEKGAWDVLVCGAGPAGLASAAVLGKAGARALVLEAGEQPATSWRGRHEGLRLNSLGWISRLPGDRGNWGWRHYPTRDEWIAYLERYVVRQALSVRFRAQVRRIDREEGGWSLETSRGRLRSPRVVVATGLDREPYLPDWPGRDSFSGVLMHSAAFGNAGSLHGKDVLVVGANTSGVEIAGLASSGGARRVRVAMRTPPNLVSRYSHGLPSHAMSLLLNRLPRSIADRLAAAGQRLEFGRLTPYGVPPPPLGIKSMIEQRGIGPAVDDGFVRGIKGGSIEIVPAVERFETGAVGLANGTAISPEVVIAATGYRRALDGMVGHLGVLDGDGRPRVHGGSSLRAAPGLHFVGYRANVSGPLHQIRHDATDLGRSVACNLDG